MNAETFSEYLKSQYTSPGSGTVNSYLRAIKILDELFIHQDIFNLKHKTLCEIRDPLLMQRIINFIIDEEDKYKAGTKSIFESIQTNQTSYPRKGFCRAAIKKLGEFVESQCLQEVSNLMSDNKNNGLNLSKKLSKRFQIDERGTETEVRAKHRLGQDFFRHMLLDIYNSKCCISGLEIPEVLRASHIVSWAEREDTRLDPANGICLSATYDAAFDKYLITFDEDYRMVLSPALKDAYSSEAFKTHFLNFEGKKMSLPSMFIPSQDYLEIHRERLIS